ncbi:MAG TPA: TetR/AcrR family transcriptional regulator [Symbiobacteriaceae bacterium]|nr:TetR/AcrR family transcriptional regulator [Symbiobacteriaceae bacterium]
MKRAELKTATRSALMDAALALIARQGYEETTVAQIAREAGVAKGTFFNYFQTKEDVLIQVVKDQLLWVVGQFGALAGTSGSLACGVREIMVQMVTRLPYTSPLIRAMFRASLSSHESVSGYVGPSVAMVHALVPVMAEGQSRGEFRSDLSAERLAFLTAQTYFGVLWAWCMGPGDDSLGALMAQSFDAFFQGACSK